MRVPARRRAPMCARVYNYSRKLANTALVATERASNRALDRCPATAPAIATAAQALPRARRSAARRRRRRRTRCALPPRYTHVALQPATTLLRALQKRKRKDEKESKKSKKSKKDKKGKDKKEKKGKDKKEKRSKRDKERAKLVETATGAHHCPPGHRPRARPPAARPCPRLHSAAGLAGGGWGKYGIIREGDMYTKQEEFLSWLADVKVGTRYTHPRYSPTILTHYTHPLYSPTILTSALLSMAPLQMRPSLPLTRYSPLAGCRVRALRPAGLEGALRLLL